MKKSCVKKRQLYHSPKKICDSAKRIASFKSLIKEGPTYICAVCHRCLYRRSVVMLDLNKYHVNENVIQPIASSDLSQHICITCHKKLLKGDIPCQAVCNKLEIFESDLHNLNRLERVLIARRILFKKVAIMPKGQYPKICGSICNIPVQSSSFISNLPNTMDTNGIILVKLKRKLSFRGHVYFEAVSP